jgi:hypothetical protein
MSAVERISNLGSGPHREHRRVAILGALRGSFAQPFQEVQKDEESSFLPGSSESVGQALPVR